MEQGILKIKLTPDETKNFDAETGTKAKVDLTEHVEVNKDYLYLFKNVWLKYQEKKTNEVFSGGSMIEETRDTVTLRNIQQKTIVLCKIDTVFYCKENNQIYTAVKEIIIERQKLHVERVRLYNEKKRLEALERILNSKG